MRRIIVVAADEMTWLDSDKNDSDQLRTHIVIAFSTFTFADVKEVIIRRCAVVGDCKYIAKNEKQSCFECAHDLCNDGKWQCTRFSNLITAALLSSIIRPSSFIWLERTEIER